MNSTCVSLDLETTGLDPDNDLIIEIGATKFRGEETLDTFHSLVNPDRPVPHRVRLLTGINDGDLKPAPPFSAVVGDLAAFIGDHPIVGQNIEFDLGFLRSQGLSLPNASFDVYELANVLFPQLADYSLPALARHLGVPCPVHHRALDDAVTAQGVFVALLEAVNNLELPLVAEVSRMTMATDWPWHYLFLEAERSKVGRVSLWDREQWEEDFTPHSVGQVQAEPLVPESVITPLDLDWLSGLLAESGAVAQAFPGYEYRHGQVSMMREVAAAFNEGRRLIVEAGTGIGKSLAYLLPASFFARQNSVPVVVSTNTINLQDQLMNKDIPGLVRAVDQTEGQHLGSNLRASLLKGRANYLCLRRWNLWRKTPGLPWEETRFLVRLLLWLSGTSRGDRAEISLVGGENSLWNRVCASEDNCVKERCRLYPGGCFLYRARHDARGAHLIVVNHALLLSDMAKGGGILPEYSYLVIDEAHRLEEEATEQLGYRVGGQEMYGCLDHLGDRGSLAFHLRNYLRTTSIASARRREIEEKTEGLAERSSEARLAVARLLEALSGFVGLLLGGHGEYERNLRFSSEVRAHPGWPEVELSWRNVSAELGDIETALDGLCATLEELPQKGSRDLSDALAEIASLEQQIGGLRSRVQSIIVNPDDDVICWARLPWQGDAYLHAAPLRVGQLLEKSLFSRKDGVVVTSATLSIGGDFEYAKASLGLAGAGELLVEAPFDYANSTLIYLPQDMSEPNGGAYQRCVGQSLVDVCGATRGRTLALFTSHAALRAAHAAVQPLLEKEGIMVLGQGVDGSPRKVLNNFRANPESVLLGTSSLWEGVDVVGPGLSVLFVARIPFGVPTDPVLSARSELFEDPFNDYLVPQAVLKFKQGFGRLIRSRSDRGVVIFLDKRLQTKRYGRVFLDSLPKCTVKSGTLSQMRQEVLGWLGD